MIDVRVVGDALLDVGVSAAATPRHGADVPARVTLLPGGQGANLAVRLARTGLRVELVCALGADAAGTILGAGLEGEGVRVRAAAAPASGVVIVLRALDGERTMLSQRIPLAAPAAEHLGDGAAWLILSGYALAEPAADVLVEAALGSPRRVVVGCALEPGMVDDWRRRVHRLEPDLLILNRDEERRLAPVPQAGILVVTDAQRVTLRREGAPLVVRVPPQPGPALDTTGAGDAFAAGLLAALHGRPWPPDDELLRVAAASAAALAARVTRVEGAQGRVAGEPPR